MYKVPTQYLAYKRHSVNINPFLPSYSTHSYSAYAKTPNCFFFSFLVGWGEAVAAAGAAGACP